MKLQSVTPKITVIIIAGLLFANVVQAHAGGKMQVASVDAGAFKLTVWTSPDPARTGEVHVATAVASAESALPVLDAEVFIRLTPQDNQGAALSEQATTEEATNQFLYEAIFDVSTEGLYEVTVTVVGVDGEQGEISFALPVESGPPLILGIVGLVALSVVTGIAVFLYLRWTQPEVESETGQ